jgi:hypothetical protein
LKTILYLLLLFAFTSSVMVTGQAVGANDSVVQASQALLPILLKDACTSTANPSPFSLQIAALHQVTSAGGSTASSLRSLTAAEEQELFEAAAYSKLTDALRDSGAGWTRVYLQWADIEPNPPQAGQPSYSWSWYDARLLALARSGVQMIVTIGVAPSWAAPTPCSPFYDQHYASFTRFVRDVVNRYKAAPYNVKVWELVNEPDGVSPESWQYGWGCWGMNGGQYAEMLKQVYPAIKSADPQATVLMGGLAYDHFSEYRPLGCADIVCNFNRYFVDDVMKSGGGDFFDALNFHYFPAFAPEWERWNIHPATCGDVHDGMGLGYYAGGIDLIAKTNHLRNRVDKCYKSSKPVWVTELAEHGYPETLVDQARYVIVGNVRALAAGVKNVTWYALVTVNDEFEQGLLDDNWNPKPGYRAYQTLTRQLTGYAFINSLPATDGEAYLFGNGCGQQRIVAWGTGNLTLTPAARLKEVDRQGTATVITDGGAGDADGVVNGSIRLQLSADPIFVTKDS